MTEQTHTQTNEVLAANESRFNAAHFSEALTAFSAGLSENDDLQKLLNFIAPTVYVGRRFEFKKASSQDAFLAESDDVRAIGSSFKRIEFQGSSVNEKTLNKGLTIRIDHDEIASDDWQERHVKLLIQRLLRNDLIRAINTLESNAQEISLDWTNQAANPDADLRKALIEAANKSGVRPNRILFSEAAWDLRASAYEALANAGAFRSADSTPKNLASKLLVEDIEILRARFQNEGKFNPFIPGSIFAFFGQDNPTKDEPSNLKRFVTPIDGNANFRVYLDESSKYTDITVEHYSNIVATSPVGIQKINLNV